VDEHSLHSPHLFDFYTNVVRSKNGHQGNAAFESLRNKLLKDTREIDEQDLGSGNAASPRTIMSIAATSLSPRWLSAFYARIIKHFNARIIIELGTSLGINSLYLAEKKDSSVTTFEGSPAIAEIALLTFEFAGAKNISLIQGNLETTLNNYLQSVRKIDFALIDANHRYLPTVKYFERLLPRIHESSVVVVDDIHQSSEMEKAWKEIRSHRLIYTSLDLFRCGILFFDPSLNKQNVILQF